MQREIKSYVLRQGRMSTRQTEALMHLSATYLLPVEASIYEAFPTEHELIVEIGFGMGDSLLQMAQENPSVNFLGIEVHQPGLGSLMAKLHEAKVTNVRLINEDAVTVLKNRIKDDTIAGFQIFFPDPWPKARHHKRRLIQPQFVSLLVQKLKVSGFVHCATDWEAYALDMLTVLDAEPKLSNDAGQGQFSTHSRNRPLTKFEKRGQNLGHGIWDLIYTRTR